MRQKNIHYFLTFFFLLLCGMTKAEDVKVALSATDLASQEALAVAIGDITEKSNVNLVLSLKDETTQVTDAQLLQIKEFIYKNSNSITGVDLSAMSSITTLPSGMFNFKDDKHDNNIISIVLPKLSKLSDNLFANCTSLTSLTIGNWKNTDAEGLEIAEIPAGCFQACGNLVTLKVKGVSNIGKSAFSGCTSMKSFPIESLAEDASVKLDDDAFQNTGLANDITLPEGISEIGAGCFAACPNLVTLTIPSTTAKIDASFVDYSKKLENIYVNEANTNYLQINGILYKNEEGESLTLVRCPIASQDPITIPDDKNITAIGDRAFFTCLSTTVNLNKELQSIGEFAFHQCNNLQALTIPATTTQIDPTFINVCGKLATLTAEEGNSVYYTKDNITYAHATKNGENVDEVINYLEIFRVPEGYPGTKIDLSKLEDEITYVGKCAFENVANVAELTLPTTVTAFADECFKNSGIQTFHVPQHLTIEGYANAPFSECKQLTKFVDDCDDQLDNFKVVDNLLYNKEQTKLFKVPTLYDNDTHTIALDHSVQEVHTCAFENAQNIKTVIFAQGTKTVPLRCFMNAWVENVFIPNSVTEIGQDVFMYSQVKNVTMLSTTQVAPKTGNSEELNYNSFFGISGDLKIHLSQGYDNFKDNWVAASKASSTDERNASREYGWEGMEKANRLQEDVSHRAIFEKSDDITGFDQNVINESDQANTLAANTHYKYITLYRSFKGMDDNTYATLALPFDVTKATLVDAFGANSHIWKFVGRKNGTLSFETVNLTDADNGDIVLQKGVAVLFQPEYKEDSYLLQMDLGGENTEPNVEAIDADAKTSFGASYFEKIKTDGNWNVVNGEMLHDVTFHYGFYATYQKSAPIEASSYYMLADGSFKYTKNGTKIKKAFRGFIHGDDNAAINDEPEAKAMISIDGTTTSIDDVHIEGFERQHGDIYGINGQLVRKGATSTDGLSKGVYIMNGKKIVIK